MPRQSPRLPGNGWGWLTEGVGTRKLRTFLKGVLENDGGVVDALPI